MSGRAAGDNTPASHRREETMYGFRLQGKQYTLMCVEIPAAALEQAKQVAAKRCTTASAEPESTTDNAAVNGAVIVCCQQGDGCIGVCSLKLPLYAVSIEAVGYCQCPFPRTVTAFSWVTNQIDATT
jgi:hypothetical protein